MLNKNQGTKLIAIAGALSFIGGATSVNAAGFQLKEQSAEGQGNSFAGQTAKAVDASTIFFNPAGMTRLKGNKVQSNLSYIDPSAKYDHGGNNATGSGYFPNSSSVDGGEIAFVPAAYAVWDYTDTVKFGIGVNAPFGLSTKYDKNWVGAEYNVFSEVKTINVAPSFAVKLNEQLSVGGSIQFQKIEGTLSNQRISGAPPSSATTTLEADDTGFGYSLGFLYEYSDKGRVGFNYRSKIKHTLKGDISNPGIAALNFDAHADLTLPAVASLGIYHDVSDKWAVLADVAWTDWSQFDKLEVKADATGTTVASTEYHWDDTLFVAIGANYQYDDKLQLKFGIAYDEGAANDKYRTAGIPDATRYWTSVGANYKLNQQSTVNVGFSHIRAKKAKISEDTKTSSYNGEFDPKVNILSVGYEYSF
jgi:long-chain fatty acid transport protein